jgi:hypothetical protein
VRAAVAPLALGLSHWSLDAGHARLDLARSERSVGWTGSGRHPGLPALEFRFSFAADCRGRQHPSE